VWGGSSRSGDSTLPVRSGASMHRGWGCRERGGGADLALASWPKRDTVGKCFGLHEKCEVVGIARRCGFVTLFPTLPSGCCCGPTFGAGMPVRASIVTGALSRDTLRFDTERIPTRIARLESGVPWPRGSRSLVGFTQAAESPLRIGEYK
jgi:hypothetical protein